MLALSVAATVYVGDDKQRLVSQPPSIGCNFPAHSALPRKTADTFFVAIPILHRYPIACFSFSVETISLPAFSDRTYQTGVHFKS